MGVAAPTVEFGDGRREAGWHWGTRAADGSGQSPNREEGEVDWAPFAGLLVGREAYEDVGEVRADYVLWHADVEYCLRMRAKGWRVLAAPAALVTHPAMELVERRLAGRTVAVGRIPPWREYYDTRNMALLRRQLRGTPMAAGLRCRGAWPVSSRAARRCWWRIRPASGGSACARSGGWTGCAGTWTATRSADEGGPMGLTVGMLGGIPPAIGGGGLELQLARTAAALERRGNRVVHVERSRVGRGVRPAARVRQRAPRVALPGPLDPQRRPARGHADRGGQPRPARARASRVRAAAGDDERPDAGGRAAARRRRGGRHRVRAQARDRARSAPTRRPPW